MAEQGDQSGSGPFTNPYGFNKNQTVILKHYFGKTLRINPEKEDEADYKGGHGQFATWTVELDGQEDGLHVIKLKSTKSGKYFRIWRGGKEINVGGTGGKLTRFKVYKQEKDNAYKLESVNFAKRYPAVQPNGDDAQKVAIGNGGKYTEFTIWSNEEDGPYAPPSDEKENKEEMEQQDQSGSGDFKHPYLLNGNQTVILKHYYGQTLRIEAKNQTDLDFKGGHGKFATWDVELDGEEDGCKVVKLKSTLTGKYLRIWKGGKEANVGGNGGKLTRFKAHKIENKDNSYKLESINFAGKYPAVQPKGCGVGTGGKYTEFTIWCNAEDVDQAAIQKQKEEEEAKKKAEEEEAKRKAEEEAAAKKKAEEEEAARLAAEAAAKEEEERKKREEEEAAAKAAAEEEERKRKEEEEARLAAEAAAKEEEERKRKEEEEAAKKAAEEEAARLAAEAAAKEEEERKRKEEEEAAAAKKAEEEAAAKKRAEEEEAARLAAEAAAKEEEEERKRKEEEEAAAKKKAEEEEAARLAAEAAAKEEEERKRKEEEEAAAKKAAEEEAARLAAEAAAKEEEERKKREEEEAAAKAAAEEEERKKREEEEAAAAKKAEEEAAAAEAAKKAAEEEEAARKAAEEEESCSVDIAIGMKFQMGSVYYSVKSVDKTVVCEQLGDDMKDDEFPDEIILQKKQMEHVLILSDDEYNNKIVEYKAKKEVESDQAEKNDEETEEVKVEEIKIEIGAKFQMGTTYYSVIEVDKYVKCEQLGGTKDDEFPDELILEKNQFNHVKILTDDEYDAAVTEKSKQVEEKKEDEEKEEKETTEDAMMKGLNAFTRAYTFDKEGQVVIIRHKQGKTLRINPKDEGKLCEKGGSGKFARWLVEFDGGDKFQRITLKNTKTDKYLQIIDDGKEVNVSGEKDDDHTFFKAVTNDKDAKNFIQLESCQFAGKCIGITAEEGIIITSAEDANTKFSFWTELKLTKGLKFAMGDITYKVEAIGDHIECKQCGGSPNDEFPDIIYLEKNQLNHVKIIEEETLEKPKPKKEEPPKSARAKAKMFEQKQKEASTPSTSPKIKPKKLNKAAMNAKFGAIHINPAALKPGATRPKKKDKEGQSLDQTAKVEQATITTGKRKRRKKKKVVIEEEEAKENVAPQLFYDEKAAEKSKKEKEKQDKAAAKKAKKSGGTKGGGNAGGSAGGNDEDRPPPQGGGSCCIIQ